MNPFFRSLTVIVLFWLGMSLSLTSCGTKKTTTPAPGKPRKILGLEGGAGLVNVSKHKDQGHSHKVVTTWTDKLKKFKEEKKYDEGGTLVVGIKGDASTLLPVTAVGVTSQQVYSLLFLTLTTTNPDFSHGPGLAKSWEFSEDQLQITFHLNDNVFWHDGVKTTAHDVKFSFERQRDPKVAWSAIKWKDHISKCEVIDDFTVKFYFTKKYPYQLMDAAVGAIMPKHILGNVPPGELKNHSFGQNPIGNGPFKFKLWKRNDRIEIVANEKYHTGRPPLDRIIFRIITDEDQLAHSLKIGEVDFVEALAVSKIPRLNKESSLVAHVVDSRSYTYLAWNLRNPLFTSKKVRHALTMSINRKEIIDSHLKGFGEICKGPVSPILAASNPNLPEFPFDPQKARDLFAAEGWRDTDGDKILDKDGKKFSFVLKTNKGNSIREKIVVQIQDMLKQVGVEVKTNIMDAPVMFAQLKKKEFEAVVVGWSVSLKTDMTTLWHSKQANTESFNFTSYSNPDFDKYNDTAVMEPDALKAQELWWKAQEVIVQDQPYTFLFVPKDINWVHKRFQNVQMETVGWHINLEQWWVKKADRKY